MVNILYTGLSLVNTDYTPFFRPLAAVIDALCNPIIKLRSTFPMGACSSDSIATSQGDVTRSSDPKSPGTENVSTNGSMVQLGEMSSVSGARYPILSEVMSYHSHSETAKFNSWNFSDVLNRLLVIVSQPIHEALSGEKISFSSELVTKARYFYHVFFRHIFFSRLVA